MALILLFWLSIFLLVYSYFIYPVLLFFLSSYIQLKRSCDFLFNKKDWRLENKPVFLPYVTIVVPAYNEAVVINQKIENFLALDYPQDKIELIFSSDGSSDNTVELARARNIDNVKVIDSPRKGKPNAVNNGIAQARGEIIVLSDAYALLAKDAVSKLTRHFSDLKIGCVIGEIYMETESGKAIEDVYGRYEIILKYMENRIGAVLSASGAIYAIRKSEFKPLPLWVINDDFVLPLLIRERGCKVIYDSEAVAFEKPPKNAKSEFKRRVRIGIGGFQGLRLTWRMLNPLRGPAALAYWSHKLLRWVGPFLLISAFVANAFLLGQTAYKIIFIFHACFYLLALLGSFKNFTQRNQPIFKIPYYFVYMNAALFYGFLKFISGTKMVTWEKTQR
ncbi:MAG: glycosyltransferase family 2 protein [Candidatus Omnitrophota bacterium]